MDIQLANRLQKLRTKRGLSQEELAGKIGVSRQAVSKWERGESLPDTDNLLTLAKVYNLKIDDMLYSENLSKDQKNIVGSKSNDRAKTWDEQKSKWRGLPFPLVAIVKFIFLIKELFSSKKNKSSENIEKDQ